MRIIRENIPRSLSKGKTSLIRCIDAMCGAMPVRQILLFGSHARGQARGDSDVDLCIVADGAGHQMSAARSFRRAMREIRPKLAFSLVPITPKRLEEKMRVGDHFFRTIAREGICLAKEDSQIERSRRSRDRQEFGGCNEEKKATEVTNADENGGKES